MDHQRLYIEGPDGKREEGYFLTQGLNEKKYFNLNILDFVAGTIDLKPRDLSSLNLGSEEDQRIYLHNGSSQIVTDNGTTNKEGYYSWDNGASEFKLISNW